MDDYLYSLLQSKGLIDTDGISRKARASRCRTCNRRTLQGLDADRAAMAVVVEGHEIDRIGEVLAVVRGLTTYTMRYIGGRWELDYRMPIEMKHDRPWPVYPLHRCDVIYPSVKNVHPRIAGLAKKAIPDDPPF